MDRGYARNERDERRLIAAGLHPNRIYLEGRGRESIHTVRMRKGELLAVVDGLRALGRNHRDIAAAVARVHASGAVVIDAETKQRSDQNGVEMLGEALSRIRGERTIGNRAADMQAASVEARTKGRMPAREAKGIWMSPDYTVGEALARMPGWSKATAYSEFKKRNLPRGRR